MALQAAIGVFFVEFAKLETQFISLALRALTNDPILVDNAESLLDLDARLKLMERMGFARSIPAPLMEELESSLLRVRKLNDQRRAVARTLLTDAGSGAARQKLPHDGVGRARLRRANYARLAQAEKLIPALSDLRKYSAEAVALQDALHVLAEKLDRHRLALMR